MFVNESYAMCSVYCLLCSVLSYTKCVLTNKYYLTHNTHASIAEWKTRQRWVGRPRDGCFIPDYIRTFWPQALGDTGEKLYGAMNVCVCVDWMIQVKSYTGL